jgi:hypothetical protein
MDDRHDDESFPMPSSNGYDLPSKMEDRAVIVPVTADIRTMSRQQEQCSF